MSSPDIDKIFTGSIPQLYERYLVPLIFEPYAPDLVNRLTFIASPQVTTVSARSRAESFRDPVIAYWQGTPLRNEIEARDASRLGEATDIAAEAIARRFGREAVDGKIQAHIVTIES